MEPALLQPDRTLLFLLAAETRSARLADEPLRDGRCPCHWALQPVCELEFIPSTCRQPFRNLAEDRLAGDQVGLNVAGCGWMDEDSRTQRASNALRSLGKQRGSSKEEDYSR